MPFRFEGINDPHGYLANDTQFVELLSDYTSEVYAKHTKLHLYFTDEEVNSISTIDDRYLDGRLRLTGQEIGLPYRITGTTFGDITGDAVTIRISNEKLRMKRKEPLTENEIGWRVEALGDFLYGERDGAPKFEWKPKTENEALAEQIVQLLDVALHHQREPNWLHEMYKVGAVHGFVDIAIRMNESVQFTMTTENDVETIGGATFNGQPLSSSDFDLFGRSMQWYIASPYEVVPLVEPRYPSMLWGWALSYKTQTLPNAKLSDNAMVRDKQQVDWIELFVPGRIQVYRMDPRIDGDYELVDGMDIPVPEGMLPVVHLQHATERDEYEGCGEVERLIPLQDELNTRLSDRGRGITWGANPPWVGKGVQKFDEIPFGPDVRINIGEDEEVERLGSDSKDQGQDDHIAEIRDALDRVSSIPPLAAGDVKDQLGNLTSAVALKVVLRGMIAKLRRLRKAHGRALAEIAEKTLTYANAVGVLKTSPEDRRIEIDWGDPIEIELQERLDAALSKKTLGVPDNQIWKELGYDDEEIKAFEQIRKARQEELRQMSDMGSFSDNADQNN